MVNRYKTLLSTSNHPEIIINSVDMKQMVDLVTAGDFDGLTNFLSAEIEILKK